MMQIIPRCEGMVIGPDFNKGEKEVIGRFGIQDLMQMDRWW